ncbi:MAG TPA: rhodanese-like domain-containing protein [Gemmatimonadota bacterium]|nr:rhodanese-like domain-containing protein [Gemmatimonadota bacterium]
MSQRIVLSIAVGVLLAACGEPRIPEEASAPAPAPAAAPGARLVTPAEARTLVAWPGVQVVDVRTEEEYAAGHLPGARRVQLDEIGAAIDAGEFPASPETPLLVYCRAGSRSAQAAALLSERGFQRVYDLEGGITAWGEAGQPVLR